MNFLVISSAPILQTKGSYVAYAPFVREMNIWFEQVEMIDIVCPTQYSGELLIKQFDRQDVSIRSVPNLYIGNLKGMLSAITYVPLIVYRLSESMQAADHIHLRCPGNMGLLGAIVQIFFPKKKKTAKYAGNWDPKAKQPWSYQLQQWILSNPFLTKNMQVLVYGDWPNQTPNIKPFFTATYTEADKTALPQRKYDLPLRFLFVGSLVPGKRPLYALELVAALIAHGFPAELHFYGDGALKEPLLDFIAEESLSQRVFLHGNQSAEVVKAAYTKSHFLILPSKSEGWPKAVAEAMWWGVIPIATKISCVPWMLDHGDRGILIEHQLERDLATLTAVLKDRPKLKFMAQKASEWSRKYTLALFEAKIKKLL